MSRSKILMFSLAVSTIFVASAFAAPMLAVDQPTFDFGKISQGKKVEHVFILKNKGDAPLNIIRTKTSCGCTVANVSTKVIEPGKSAELKAAFDSGNFGGNVIKTITVETNDPAAPAYTLTIKGAITEDIVFAPKQLNLGAVKVGTGKEASLTIENRGQKTLHIKSVTSPMQQLRVSARKQTLKPGESSVLSVTVTPRTEDRFLSGFISIATDNPAKPEITVPVYGSVAK